MFAVTETLYSDALTRSDLSLVLNFVTEHLAFGVLCVVVRENAQSGLSTRGWFKKVVCRSRKYPDYTTTIVPTLLTTHVPSQYVVRPQTVTLSWRLCIQ